MSLLKSVNMSWRSFGLLLFKLSFPFASIEPIFATFFFNLLGLRNFFFFFFSLLIARKVLRNIHLKFCAGANIKVDDMFHCRCSQISPEHSEIDEFSLYVVSVSRRSRKSLESTFGWSFKIRQASRARSTTCSVRRLTNNFFLVTQTYKSSNRNVKVTSQVYEIAM